MVTPAPRWTRPPHDRLVGGVAAGVARGAGLDPVLVRVGFVVLAAAGGLGVLAYLALWALMPSEQGAAPLAGSLRTVRLDSPRRLIAAGLMALGGLLLVRRLGLWLGDGLVWPLLLVAAGSVVVWARADVGGDRSRDGEDAGDGRGPLTAVLASPASPARIVIGGLLALVGIAGFLAVNVSLAAVRDLGLALFAATVGLVLLLGPWLWRLGTQLTAERRERIRQEERAELAAHLHDSVLQTLALIQRAEGQPRRMVTLARRQERELRDWLYGAPGAAGGASRAGRLAAGVRALGEEVESVHGVALEVVVVGDAPLDARLEALLAAVREACVNAAKHAGAEVVDVYVEVDEAEGVAFVRDRGRGFDPEAVREDRRGIRDSIVGRLRRHGGRARVTSRPGEGTEVEMAVPREAAEAPGDPDDPSLRAEHR